MADFLRFDEDNVITEGAEIFMAKVADVATPPLEQEDIYDPRPPYDAETGWFRAGATSDGPTYTQAFEIGGVRIQQSADDISRQINTQSDRLAVPFAEFTKQFLEILHQTTGDTTAARDRIRFGRPVTLGEYRIAFAVRRSESKGIVTMTSATPNHRGRDFGVVLGRVELNGDDVAVKVARGELTAATITFRAKDDPAWTAENTERGWWWNEKVRTIAAP